ncbi:MAG: glycerol-3-phosphate cytidylyltransferase [Lachnospiraceae bacterium]|nr:glycerol-3-phosphate cytidylyltransferase [Lachnospiraceae bacterium]
MKKVITYGTYDLLHVGHINLLRRARALGDYLLVVLSTDEFNALKNKTAYHSYEDRKKILEAIRYVDEVIPEYTWEQKISDVVNNNIDVFVMGDDWAGKFDFLKDYCEVVYLPRTEGVSTTKIKNDLHLGKAEHEEQK